jgi:hypothetical protein
MICVEQSEKYFRTVPLWWKLHCISTTVRTINLKHKIFQGISSHTLTFPVRSTHPWIWIYTCITGSSLNMSRCASDTHTGPWCPLSFFWVKCYPNSTVLLKTRIDIEELFLISCRSSQSGPRSNYPNVAKMSDLYNMWKDDTSSFRLTTCEILMKSHHIQTLSSSFLAIQKAYNNFKFKNFG